MFGFYRVFHRLVRPGKVTFFLVICLCVQSIFFNQDQKIANKIALVHYEYQSKEHIAKIYLEYCISHVVDRDKCLFTKSFFLLKNKKGGLGKTHQDFSNTLDDLGDSDKATDRFYSFYQKLLVEDSELKKLSTYPEFIEFKNKTYAEIKKIHQQYNKFSSLNPSLISILKSFFDAGSWGKMFWILLVFLVFGRGLELILGGNLFFLAVIFGNLFVVYFSFFNFSGTTEVISLEFVLPSFIFGVLFGLGRKVQFYFSKKWRLPLKVVIVFLWGAQELFLHLSYSLTTTHLIHFLSLMFGMIFGKIFQAKSKLPFGFLSPHVYQYWEEVRSQSNLESMLNIGVNILEENPDNFTVKQDMLVAILDAQLKSNNQVIYWNILEIILTDLVSIYCLQDTKRALLLQILNLVPETIPLYPYLDGMNFKKHRTLIKLASKEEDFFLVIKLLESVLVLHRKARKIFTEKSLSLQELSLERIEFEEKKRKNIYRKYILNSKSIYLQNILTPYLRN